MATIPLDELIKEEEALLEKLKANRAYMKAFHNYVPVKSPAPTTPITVLNTDVVKKPKPPIRKKKSKGLTIPEKVKNALALIGTGKTKDVANKMIEIYAEYQNDNEKAIGDARYHVSALAKNGVLEVIDQGNGNAGNTYKIKE